MNVTKMQGLGNDYLFHYGDLPDPSGVSRRLSDRHWGIGADGLILILPSEMADFRMRVFNADGSEASMCGNGIRCAGKYVYDYGYTNKRQLHFETLAGIRSLTLDLLQTRVIGATVDMGQAVISESITAQIDHRTCTILPVHVGNPHAVLFLEEHTVISPTEIGPLLNKHPAFPDGVNVDLVQVIDQQNLRMRVWERGSGVTMACGTGACAAVAAATRQGLCPFGTTVRVNLDGGPLNVTAQSDGTIYMQGPAETICECEIPASSSVLG